MALSSAKSSIAATSAGSSTPSDAIAKRRSRSMVARMRARPPSARRDGRRGLLGVGRGDLRRLLRRGHRHGERVVQLVRHPADQHAQRLELLDEDELLLHPPQARDVRREALDLAERRDRAPVARPRRHPRAHGHGRHEQVRPRRRQRARHEERDVPVAASGHATRGGRGTRPTPTTTTVGTTSSHGLCAPPERRATRPQPSVAPPSAPLASPRSAGVVLRTNGTASAAAPRPIATHACAIAAARRLSGSVASVTAAVAS